MEYIPGYLHEKLQEEHYYEILNDFTMSIINEGHRYADLNSSNDYDKYTDSFNLFKNDILCIKYFKTNEDSYAYSYIVAINNVKIERESLLSRELIESNKKLFDNITFVIKRDKLIDSILC